MLFIGAGAMAESIIAGMLKSDCTLARTIFVTNKSNSQRLQELQNRYRVEIINLEKKRIDEFMWSHRTGSS